jgi:hypothetical protein
VIETVRSGISGIAILSRIRGTLSQFDFSVSSYLQGKNPRKISRNNNGNEILFNFFLGCRIVVITDHWGFVE